LFEKGLMEGFAPDSQRRHCSHYRLLVHRQFEQKQVFRLNWNFDQFSEPAPMPWDHSCLDFSGSNRSENEQQALRPWKIDSSLLEYSPAHRWQSASWSSSQALERQGLLKMISEAYSDLPHHLLIVSVSETGLDAWRCQAAVWNPSTQMQNIVSVSQPFSLLV
jgi:hypothetical protein